GGRHGGGHCQFRQGFYAVGVGADWVAESERSRIAGRNGLGGRAGPGQKRGGAVAGFGLAEFDGRQRGQHSGRAWSGTKDRRRVAETIWFSRAIVCAAGRGEVGKITGGVARRSGRGPAQPGTGEVAGRSAVRIFAGRTGGKTGRCRAIARVVSVLGLQGNARGAGSIAARTAGGF